MPRRSPRGKPYHRPTSGRPRDHRTTPPGEHIPVLLAEVLAVLDPQPDHVVADCTLGFGGHAAELLRHVGPTGRLIATDLDADNLSRVDTRLAAVGFPFTIRHANFAGLPAVLAEAGLLGVDRLVADLGVSSMQLDNPARGFSFLRDGPLDMRMDPSRGKTAAELLSELSEAELAAAFAELGDEPEAWRIAAAIVARRGHEPPLTRTVELRELIARTVPVRVARGPGAPSERKQKLLPATRVFQALRLLVNRELTNLRELLRVLPTVLNPGGVAAIISFHSGEDRLVKSAFRDGIRANLYSAVSDEPIRPTEAEKAANPRSRSAKLRWARRVA